MDETRPRLGLRAVLGAVAVALVVAAFWAASAFAGGGSPSSDRGARADPAAADVQNEGQAPDRGDCPNDDEAEPSSSL